jgi:hypothetical protein
MLSLSLLLALLLLPNIGKAQDVIVTPNGLLYSDTLTETIDSIQVHFPVSALEFVTVTVYTTTGADTVTIWTRPFGGLLTQKAAMDLSVGTYVTQLIVSTTPKEYEILTDFKDEIELRTSDVSASIVFILAGKEPY